MNNLNFMKIIKFLLWCIYPDIKLDKKETDKVD